MYVCIYWFIKVKTFFFLKKGEFLQMTNPSMTSTPSSN